MTKRPFLCALLLLGFLAPLATIIAAPTRTLTLRGPITNLTAEATATVTLVLTIEDEAPGSAAAPGRTVSGTMKTEPPLTGSGKISGRFLGGWCELRGQLDEGFQIEFRGAFDERDYRGTYLVAIPGQPLQYGKFQLTRDPPLPPPKPDQK